MAFRLHPDERCVGVVDGIVEQWLPGGDGSYNQRFVAFGGLGGLIVGGAVSAAMNASSRSKAAAALAERWTPVAQGRVFVTSKRIAIDTGNDWWEVWYSDIRKIQYDRRGILLQTPGVPSIRLPLYPSDYWLVMTVFFVEGNIVDAPPATA